MDKSYKLFLQRSWFTVLLILAVVITWRILHWDPVRSYDSIIALVSWLNVAAVGLALLGDELVE